MPAILDNFLTGYANTISTSIGVEGGGCWGATTWWVNAMCKVKTAKWNHLELFSAPHNTQSSYIHAQPYQPVVWWFIASWLLVQWRWSHWKFIRTFVDIWQDSETSHSKSSLGNFQHWYLPDVLASVYSYHVIVKTVSCCYVHGRWVISNPVTYVYFISLSHTHPTYSIM